MAIIFNLQKFCLHDGYGIRTTVFLKGCPLHCPWCANVESQNPAIELTWDNQKCQSCKKCIELGLEKDLKFVKSEKFCNAAGERLLRCNTTEENAKLYKQNCPSGALSYEGYQAQIDEIIKEVLKDEAFYRESGGGMTLSGGEVLMQADFASQLLKSAKEHNLHTAIETTCFASTADFKKVIQYVDLLLCDIKDWNSERHKSTIGVDFKLIDENIKYATSLAKLDIIARIPVIPNYNFTEIDAEKLAERLIALNIKKLNLLPYHNFGENKYRLLGKKYPLEGIDNLHKDDEEMIAYRKIFERKGLQVLD